MALRKWTWFCVLVGILSMNSFARSGLAAEENRTPAISIDFHEFSPEFIAWLGTFDEKLEQVLKMKKN